MPSIRRDAAYLLHCVRQVCEAPPPGVDPWQGRKILRLIERADAESPDHGAFYLIFMDGTRDLVEDEEEDRLFRRFARHNLATEARVHADSTETRDHLTHVTQVFLCGWLILNGCRRFATERDQWCPYGWTSEARKRFILLNRGWLYASLLHDCAYSAEYASRGQEHELVVRALFGQAYLPGQSGRVDPRVVEKKMRPLWQARAAWIGGSAVSGPMGLPPPEVDLKRAYDLLDHALVGGMALFDEAETLAPTHAELAEILRPAAVAIACHNLRWLLKTEADPEHQPNLWLRLDLWQEPLGALLHLCDELQEWSRERADEALYYQQARKTRRFAGVELTRLEIDDSLGLSVEAGLLRRLHPDDRRVCQRIVREQEIEIANTGRQIRMMFQPRTQHEDFRLHLRVVQTVDDMRCSNALTIDWPTPPRGLLLTLARDSPARDLHTRSDIQPAYVTWKEAEAEISESGAQFRRTDDRTKGLRLAVTAPGGAGKSTLLRGIAGLDAIDRVPTRFLYVEQLPAQLADLDEELRRLHDAEPHREILLLLDHLDRLDEAETGPFWLEQVRRLPREPWLHVLVACRTEEFDRAISAGLGSEFKPERLKGPKAPFAGGDGDEDGRVRARAIEAGLRLSSSETLGHVSRLAESMGHARTSQLPIPPDWISDREAYRDGPLLVQGSDGQHRFVHDALQDFLAAFHLAGELGRNHGDPNTRRGLIRRLAKLPRDVPRLLFDLLASREGRWMDRDARNRAARALAAGLLHDPTTLEWFFVSGRLDQAACALDAFLASQGGERLVRLVTARMLANLWHTRLFRSKLRDRASRAEQLDRVSKAVSHLSTCASEIEADVSGGDAYWVLQATVIELTLTLLTRLASVDDCTEDAREFARMIQRNLRDDPGLHPLGPRWFGRLMTRLVNGTTLGDWDHLLENHYTALNQLSRTRESRTDESSLWLEHRCGAMAARTGSHFLDHVDVGLDVQRLSRARRWFEISIARFDRLGRTMTQDQRAHDREQFMSLAGWRSQSAWQYSQVFATRLYAAAAAPQPPDALALLLDAHRAQAAAWRLAIDALDAGERLPHMFHQALPSLVAGRAVGLAVAAGTPSRLDVFTLLDREAKAVREQFCQLGERHPRFTADDDTPERIVAVHDRVLGDQAALIAHLVSRNG